AAALTPPVWIRRAGRSLTVEQFAAIAASAPDGPGGEQ
ncbi:16S rRNA (adenine(1518)-N(6)/adenine(1519)-N(6))-dimethyltransferase, partial [Micromonospora provocatoris]